MRPYLISLLILTSCCPKPDCSSPKISSITIIDQNGFTETVTSKDRLQQYERVNFFNPQSYQKVLRVYGRDSSGNVQALLTSYHANGQLKEYLEARNNNAHGCYCEWYPNGQKKLEASVISGAADLTESAKLSWLFDGVTKVWAEDGSYEATILYSNGFLDGTSFYYHPSGKLWKQIPYVKGKVDGSYKIYLENGECLQVTGYKNGVKHGTSLRYWPQSKIAAEENYNNGLLTNGRYVSISGKEVSRVENGFGFKALFGIDSIAELQEYKDGVQEGIVKVFDQEGTLINQYSQKNGLKHGEEIEYQTKKFGDNVVKPRLLISWYEGIIQGVIKTWYDNGVLESQREISTNKKNGLCTAWYRDGTLMMIEEYDQDMLMKGEYFKKGDKVPVSQVWEGSGIAMLFDPEGNFIRKISYSSGKPQE